MTQNIQTATAPSGVKIKICGLTRPADIKAVNAAQPDFCGFIINVPRSRRNVSPDAVRTLRGALSPEITPVGVFVNAPPRLAASLAEARIIGIIQLHGSEDEGYISTLRGFTDAPIIKAFSIRSAEDIALAEKSSADFVLLDQGSGGTGKTFDWRLIKGISRPFFLAGGLGPDNLAQAIEAVHPYAVDLSSGVETDGKKDPAKIQAAVDAVRKARKK